MLRYPILLKILLKRVILSPSQSPLVMWGHRMLSEVLMWARPLPCVEYPVILAPEGLTPHPLNASVLCVGAKAEAGRIRWGLEAALPHRGLAPSGLVVLCLSCMLWVIETFTP